TLAERKKMLYDDPDLSVVEAHRVFCIRCEKWLKLDEVKLSAILALQKRRDTIVNDPDAAIVEPRRVQCGICERWIKGSSTQEYSTHHWLKHKKKC
ncbi:hypothetical protein K439DRAFT_1236578, partial [Ramaria rubella]